VKQVFGIEFQKLAVQGKNEDEIFFITCRYLNSKVMSLVYLSSDSRKCF